jgi:hypothetical protein
MKIERRNLVVAVAAASATPAFAQFGGLGGMFGGKSSGGGGDVDSQVKAFLDKIIKIEVTVNKALLAITAAYKSDEERAKSEEVLKSLGKQTDPKEAGAKFQEAYSSSEADTKKLSESSDLAERTKNLSAAKQQQVVKGVVNFLLGALQAKDVVPMGQSVLQSVSSNPMAITKVIPIKDAVPRLTSAVSLAATTIPKFVNVLRGANIQVPEVSGSTKEEALDSLA